MSTAHEYSDTRTGAGGGFGFDKEFMTTLAKGLAVLSSFGEQRQRMTLSEAAEVTGLSRAASRRVLRTLAELGYVSQQGRQFSLAPRILELGFAYLTTQSWIDRAEPLMKELSHSLKESCSAAILQGTEIVYVARMPAPHRIMSTTIAVGTRLPAFFTSLGRVQLGFLSEQALQEDIAGLERKAYTPRTIVDPDALLERILEDRQQGYSIVDEELEHGLRSLAVPIVTRSGVNVAAINLSAHASRASKEELRDRFLPELRAVAHQISRSLP
ncbi:MAG: helix-turn-helix domain-containing protein [Bauldia sp.]|uniref:IclR family transcriptional regulator domain-containing protein n=1 Tax=Bauldia sp. TaxID=2575872 RepID=UPI001D694E1B|nr:IclR family transcriptional regulator C-terminal domain-containing protein [Bauldia sp.]MCB1497124.1 helix-turn-helix domain-containing protein [Bauldia sp.]